jgi:hypothetical protein
MLNSETAVVLAAHVEDDCEPNGSVCWQARAGGLKPELRTLERDRLKAGQHADRLEEFGGMLFGGGVVWRFQTNSPMRPS